jgi:hypothetical protein
MPIKIAPPIRLPQTAADWQYQRRPIVEGAPYIRPTPKKITTIAR